LSHTKPQTLFRRLVADQSLSAPKRVAAPLKIERPSSYFLRRLMRSDPSMPGVLLFEIPRLYEVAEARRVLRRKKLENNPNKKPDLLELK
jgi:hypothetical protein